ncbi:MAG: GH92 family glycosyl hydrolase [Acidimicrobiales bacterium]
MPCSGRWARLAAATAVVLVVSGIATGAAGAGPVGARGVPPALGHPPGAPAGIPLGATSGGPARLVDPEAGTGVGPAAPGNVSEYPGASVPLGMVQFSPDTSPDRQVTTGSGYDDADTDISGFSLTHLSGPGCAIYGDFPILPVAGAVPADTDPDDIVQPFSHASERASAGNYAVTVGSGAQAVGVRLTATTRSALGVFTFPAVSSAAGPAGGGPGDELLLKVSDSANGSSASQVRLVGDDGLDGSVTSGDFCGIPGNYTLYFAARFSQPFAAAGTWQDGAVSSDGTCAGTSAADCGAWVSFRHPGQGGRQRIVAKVGVSFVSAAGAATNLAAEDPGWNVGRISGAATAEWNGVLGRMAVQGDTVTARRTFYTALYHSLLFPSVFSDDDGRYRGLDHRVHTLAAGHVQYSNISEGDIYRSEVPLLAVLLPGPTSQMVQSLLNDAAQTPGGFLPKWVIADNDAGQWDGDSADPIIADAYAYGARRFDLRQALRVMVHGATVPEPGLLAERPNLAEYESEGWVPELTFDLTSYPYTDGGSETLEYSIDDFAISRVARATGDRSEAAAFARRGQNWQHLFDPTTGYLAARQADGSFPPGPAFQPASPADQVQGVAQQGFEEGNAIQYTWAVPQDLAGLIGLMGGSRAAVAALDTFFTQLNATRFAPYDWAGNEPGEWIPFDYDYAGAPWRTQSVVRRIMTQLYPLAPVAEPGEDDLGALSSWYVWAALGLYPETPGVADLAITSPLFPRTTVTEGSGHTLTITAAHAPDEYVRHAALAIGSGASSNWSKPWLPATALSEGADLAVDLGGSPDTFWGASPSAAPPSFTEGAAPAVPFTLPGGSVTLAAGTTATVQLGVQEGPPPPRAAPVGTVAWHVVPSPAAAGVTVSPSSGIVRLSTVRLTVPLQVAVGGPGTYAVTVDLTQGGRRLPTLTLEVDAT